LPTEKIGTIQPLLPEELRYFQVFQKLYGGRLQATREKDHNFIKPPLTWIKRKAEFVPPNNYMSQMDALIHFSKVVCKDCISAERNRWEDVLAPFEIGSLERVLWAVAFLKSTNGVADKVSCGHFRAVIAKYPSLSLEVYKEPYTLAAILWQTSDFNAILL
jgi:hypothetical protein